MFYPHRVEGLTPRAVHPALRSALSNQQRMQSWQQGVITLQVRRPEPLVPGKIDFKWASSPAPDHVEVTVYLLGCDLEAMKVWLKRLAEEPEKRLGLKWDLSFRVSAYFWGLQQHPAVWQGHPSPDLWRGYGNRYIGWLAADDGGAWFICPKAYQAACATLGIAAAEA